MNVVGYLGMVLATLVVIAHILTRPSTLMSRGLSQAPAVAIGRRSYGLYLYHWPIFLFVGVDTRPTVLAVAFGATFAVAWLSYAVVERPLLRYRARWTRVPIGPYGAPALAGRAPT